MLFQFLLGASGYDTVSEIAFRRKRMEISAFRVILCSLVLLLAHPIAQDKPKAHIEVAVVAARPEDVNSMASELRDSGRGTSACTTRTRARSCRQKMRRRARWSSGTRRNRNTRTKPMRSWCAMGSVNMRWLTRFTGMGMWRRSSAVMKERWHRQENCIHVASTSISFTTSGTDGGFPQYLGTLRRTSVRFLRS
jgi:hypothetical protein